MKSSDILDFDERLRALKMDDRLVRAGWEIGSFDKDGRPHYVTNPFINATLAVGVEIPFVVGTQVFRCPSKEALVNRLERATASGKVLFNAPKMRLWSDPEPGMRAVLGKTDFYNGLVTNEMVGEDGQSFRAAYPGDVIPTLSASAMSNHIGVAAIAIDEDGIARLCVAGRASAIEAGRLTASASGSCDIEDFDEAPGLVAAARRSVERELVEETGLLSGVPVRTKVVAFLRNLERGGKPEFVATIVVGGRWREVTKKLHADEQKYSASHVDIPLEELSAREPNVRGMPLSFALRSVVALGVRFVK